MEQSSDDITLTISDEDVRLFKRLDRFLAEKITHLSRTFLKNLFEKDLIFFDESSPIQEKKLELKKMPPIGSVICIQIPPPIPS